MEGKKTKKYKTNLIVKYNIYNSKGDFVYFSDLEMKGVDAYVALIACAENRKNHPFSSSFLNIIYFRKVMRWEEI